MENELTVPKTLQEAIVAFSNEAFAVKLMAQRRWEDGVICPHCDSNRVSMRGGRFVWLCRDCRKEFTIKIGTFMEDSPIKVGKWLIAMWMVTNCKNGVSSYEIHRAIGVTQKTAWFMMHRIRLAFGEQQPTGLCGTVEADETYIGGLEKNKHRGRKQNVGGGATGKAVVMGMMERGGKTRTRKVINNTKPVLQGEIVQHVQPGATLHTDAHKAYRGLPAEYVHEFVDHAVEYVREGVHTNSLENFFSLLKRMIKGTYVSVDPAHLHRYLDEQTFRYNERYDTDGGRFEKMMEEVHGKRLTYKQLVGSRCIF